MTARRLQGGMVLQARDYGLLLGLLDARVMTIKHAALLHFDGRHEAAKKRLQKLHRAELVVQRPRRPQDPGVYSLARAGYLRLQQEGMLNVSADGGWATIWKRLRVGELMLRHELSVMDVKAAVVSAVVARPDLELVEMSVSPERHRFRVTEAVEAARSGMRFRSIIAKPDGFLHLREQGKDGSAMEHFFFLEVDLGTESLGRLLRKAQHYNQFYRSGGFAMRRGLAREDYRRLPFRVLMVFRTSERRDHVAERLLRAAQPIRSQVWLTTIQEILQDPLGAVWVRPSDYAGPQRNGEAPLQRIGLSG